MSRKRSDEFSKDFLTQEYIYLKKSINQIAKEQGVYFNKIKRALIYYDIPIRSLSMSMINAYACGHRKPNRKQNKCL